MQTKILIVLLQFIIGGYKIVNAFIGNNIRSANENEYASTVCIMVYDPNRNWQSRMKCTGTLISYNFILSAGHCFRHADRVRFEISMGAHVLENGYKDYPVWWISFEQWAVRYIPNYVANSLIDDLLLIKIFGVWQDVPSMDMRFIRPPNNMYGHNAHMVGCGKLETGHFPQHLQVASIKVIDLQRCIDVIATLEQRNVTLTDKYFCSVGNPCTQLYFGDSGGPLVYHGKVIGVNIACCPSLGDTFNPNKVNIHVNIDRYQIFINRIVVPGY